MKKAPHLLLVEDNPLIRNMHCRYAKMAGWDVTVATTGEQVQGMLLPSLLLPLFYDLILLDLGLPDMSGFDLCAWVRRFYTADTLPIVVLSACGDVCCEESLVLGVQAYFTKPVSLSWFNVLHDYARGGSGVVV